MKFVIERNQFGNRELKRILKNSGEELNLNGTPIEIVGHMDVIEVLSKIVRKRKKNQRVVNQDGQAEEKEIIEGKITIS